MNRNNGLGLGLVTSLQSDLLHVKSCVTKVDAKTDLKAAIIATQVVLLINHLTICMGRSTSLGKKKTVFLKITDLLISIYKYEADFANNCKLLQTATN